MDSGASGAFAWSSFCSPGATLLAGAGAFGPAAASWLAWYVSTQNQAIWETFRSFPSMIAGHTHD
eukprot:1521831-Amphidinium_carterae.2